VSTWQTDPWLLDCYGCGIGLFTYSTGTTYEQYCEDGRVRYAWEERQDWYYEGFAWECINDWYCWNW